MIKRTTRATELTIGLDLGDQYTQGSVVDTLGEELESFRLRTTEPALEQLTFTGSPPSDPRRIRWPPDFPLPRELRDLAP